MDATWAAVVTGAFGLLMLLVEKGRRENVRDHGYVKDALTEIKENIADVDSDVKVIEAKIDTHINDHTAMALTELQSIKSKKSRAK